MHPGIIALHKKAYHVRDTLWGRQICTLPTAAATSELTLQIAPSQTKALWGQEVLKKQGATIKCGLSTTKQQVYAQARQHNTVQ